MGRKVKERAFEEEGEAKKLASNTEVVKYTQLAIKELERLAKREAAYKEEAGAIKADIKAVYDRASNAGCDKRAFKKAVKVIWQRIKDEESETEEFKMMTNIYLENNGQYAFFPTQDASEAA